MAHYQNSYNGRAMTPPAVPAAPGPVDWSGEIAPLTGESAALPVPGRSVTGAGRPMDRLTTAEERGPQQLGSLDPVSYTHLTLPTTERV